MAREQPVPFSHKHHAGELGIDCRYCHTSVETVLERRVPAHPDLHELPLADLGPEPGARTGARRAGAPAESIQWTKVYDLPDFVYFNHSIHVAQGHRLRELPRAASTSMNLTWQQPVAAHGVVSRLSPRPGAQRAAAFGGLQHGMAAPADQPNLGEATDDGARHSRRDDCTYVPPLNGHTQGRA